MANDIENLKEQLEGKTLDELAANATEEPKIEEIPQIKKFNFNRISTYEIKN